MNSVKENKPTFEELQDAATPLLEILKKYYNPHCKAIVTERNVEIVVGDIGMGLIN